MSNGILNAHLIGRFGNQLFQAAYARAYAEQCGLELRTNAWPGQQIFEGVNEGPLCDEGERLPDDYRQRQSDLIYTRADCRRWFKIKQEWLDWFLRKRYWAQIVAHRRIGDYAACGYVVVSASSYYQMHQRLGYGTLVFACEENAATSPEGAPPFLCDFMRLVYAPVILRGNSSFSWWAATLSNAEVWSPRIDGLEGGREQDCAFEKGNHCRFSDLEFTTDLHLPE